MRRDCFQVSVFDEEGYVCISQRLGSLEQIELAPAQVELVIGWLRLAAESAKQARVPDNGPGANAV